MARLVAKGFETRPKGGRATPPCPAPAKGATRGRRADSVARAAEAFTGSQPHARNSVASLRLTRLPEPRSVIRLLLLLRYHRPAKSPPSSLGKQTLPRSRLSRVCSTLCRLVHPLRPHRRAARLPQHAPARRSLFRPRPPSPTSNAHPHVGLCKPATGHRFCACSQRDTHPPRGPHPRDTSRVIRLWLERRIGVHRLTSSDERGRARPTVRVASRTPFKEACLRPY